MLVKFESIGTPVGSRHPACNRALGSTRADGFTLLETLVGLTIFAIALTSLLGAYSNGLKVARHTEQHARAHIVAQSLIEITTARTDRPPSSSTGRTNEFRWKVHVDPATARLAGDAQSGKWQLYHVRVDVSWGADRRYSLETLKLASVQR
ncbi:MAG: type IV pilus modification PilV family protein [Hyphomicrobiaceae bacterium]